MSACDLSGLKLPEDSIFFRENHLELNNIGDIFKDSTVWPKKEMLPILALAQHHNLPTRLLDWTRKSLVAAYFAAASSLEIDENAKPENIAVWIFNISRLGLFKNIEIVTTPGGYNKNMASQAGLFSVIRQTLYRGQEFKIETIDEIVYNSGKEVLFKVILPYSEACDLIKICDSYGINAATLFPDYYGAVKKVINDINIWKVSVRKK